jgi:hypothetical protein
VLVPIAVVLIVAGLHVPVKPLLDTFGKLGAVLFWQSGSTCVNVGVTWPLITISIVATLAQGSDGVNVYVLVPIAVVLIVAGLHAPANPLPDIVGSAGAVLFWQRGPICVNVGVTCAVTTISIVVVAAHGSLGVNVCVVVPTFDVLIVAGVHAPANPLADVAGSVGAVLLRQSGPSWVNVGVTCPVTEILIVVVVAHGSVGVNV